MKILPTMKQLKVGLKFKDKKENIVYKIIVDVLGLYLRDYGEITQKVIFINSPNYFAFQLYLREFIPFAISFYQSITDDELEEVVEVLKTITNNEICKKIF